MDKKSNHHVLIPVDFSSQSEAAVLLGCRLAKCLGAAPLVLHVVHDPGEMPGYYASTLKKKHLARIEDGAMDMMQDFLSRLAKSNKELEGTDKVESLLVKGLPVTRILEVAKKRNVTMIVMGSTGRTGLQHLFIGSVAERIVQLSPVPVTVAKIQKK